MFHLRTCWGTSNVGLGHQMISVIWHADVLKWKCVLIFRHIITSRLGQWVNAFTKNQEFQVCTEMVKKKKKSYKWQIQRSRINITLISWEPLELFWSRWSLENTMNVFKEQIKSKSPQFRISGECSPLDVTFDTNTFGECTNNMNAHCQIQITQKRNKTKQAVLIPGVLSFSVGQRTKPFL